MKNKFWISIFACILVISCGIVFASEIPSDVDDTEDDNIVYLDDYSQYLDVLNDMDYQGELKAEYEEGLKNEIASYSTIERTKVYKAKVTEASKPQVYYGQSSYGQIYKTSYQPLSIVILEGPYKDKEFEDFNYILTCDSYDNIQLSAVGKGDTINVAVVDDGEGNVTATSSSFDSSVVRWPWVLVIMIIAIIFLAIYAGNKGLKALVVLVLLVDLIIFVGAPSIINGINLAFLATVIIAFTSLVIGVLNLGVKQEAFVAIVSSLIVTFVIFLIIYGFGSIMKLCGITYEATYLMEYILPAVTSSGEIINNVDFNAFSIAITVLIIHLEIILITCETVKAYKMNKDSETVYKDTVEMMKEYLADKVVLFAGILLVLVIPKYMLLLANKCSLAELVNSEILITDISRILFGIIALSLAVPVTAILGKFADED